MKKKDETTKKEWIEAQPDGQKRAEEKRVSKYPHVLTRNSDGSICTVVRPNKKASEKKIVKHKKAVNK